MRIKAFQYFGTGAGLPSPRRNVSAMAVDFEKEWFLFDCGESTQQQIMKSKLKMSKLTRIFISHFHGDHIYGLPGLLATMQLQGVDHKITIYSPKGLKEYLEFTFATSGTRLKRQIEFVVIEKQNHVIQLEEHEFFNIEAAFMSHRIPCVGYRLRMKDLPGRFDANKADELGIPRTVIRKRLMDGENVTLDNGELIKAKDLVSETVYNPDFTYITDTRVCQNIYALAENTDVLHHECTFTDEETELADKSGHVTLGQVLHIAENSNVKQLLLAHFSSRYDQMSFKKLISSKSYKIQMTNDLNYYPIEISPQ